MLVRGPSDLSALRDRIPIPPRLRGRWAAGRRRPRAVAGYEPSPMELVLWIPVAEVGAGQGDDAPSWDEIARVVGAEGPPATIAVHVDAARALAPTHLAAMPAEGFELRATGPRYPAAVFEGGGFAGGRAVRVPGGLLVGLTSQLPPIPS